MAGRLRAIGAIFGAATGFDAQERALLNLRGVPIHAMDGAGFVHEFVEGKLVNVGNLFFGPVVANGGGDSPHFAGFFVKVEGVSVLGIVRESIGLLGWAAGVVSIDDDLLGFLWSRGEGAKGDSGGRLQWLEASSNRRGNRRQATRRHHHTSMYYAGGKNKNAQGFTVNATAACCFQSRI